MFSRFKHRGPYWKQLGFLTCLCWSLYMCYCVHALILHTKPPGCPLVSSPHCRWRNEGVKRSENSWLADVGLGCKQSASRDGSLNHQAIHLKTFSVSKSRLVTIWTQFIVGSEKSLLPTWSAQTKRSQQRHRSKDVTDSPPFLIGCLLRVVIPLMRK